MGEKSRKKRERRAEPPWTPFEEGVFPPGAGADKEKTFVNSRYQVDLSRLKPNVSDMPDMTVLSIKRRDKDVIRDWRDLQRIKNEILGPEWEGVELFPAESRLVDTANQFWLWCLPPGYRFPFGMDERSVSEHEIWNKRLGSGSRQRPFDPDARPADLETAEQAEQKLRAAGRADDFVVRPAGR